MIYILFFLSIVSVTWAHILVFVHIGNELPKHLLTTVAQARLFNEQMPIVIIANEVAISKADVGFSKKKIGFVSCESLTPSALHAQFARNTNHEMDACGLFRYSTERFFYLEEYMTQYKITDLFHIESDMMLYKNLAELLPYLHQYYSGMIATTFENDGRCVAGFLYISDYKPLKELLKCFPEQATVNLSDMELIAHFKNKFRGKWIDYLPVIMPEYQIDHPMNSIEPYCYSNHFNQFNVIFDGAALGIYSAGLDSRFHEGERAKPGFITGCAIYDPRFLQIVWIFDTKGRKIPTVIYKDKQYPIVNLHITNKSVIQNYYSL